MRQVIGVREVEAVRDLDAIEYLQVLRLVLRVFQRGFLEQRHHLRILDLIDAVLADLGDLLLRGDEYDVKALEEADEPQDAVGSLDRGRNWVIFGEERAEEVILECLLVVGPQVLLDDALKFILISLGVPHLQYLDDLLPSQRLVCADDHEEFLSLFQRNFPQIVGPRKEIHFRIHF